MTYLRAGAMALALTFLSSACALTHGDARDGALASSSTLTLGEDSVYWVDRALGEVRRAPRAGGEATRLAAAGSTSQVSVALNATHVLWIGPSGVFRAPRGGGDPELVAASELPPVGLAASDDAVYFSRQRRGDGTMRIPFDLMEARFDGATRTLVTQMPALDLTWAAGELVATTCAEADVVRIAGTEAVSLDTGAFCPLTVRVMGESVFFSDQQVGEPGGPGGSRPGIFRAPLSGGRAIRVTESDSFIFAAHRGFIYTVLDGAIVRVAADGSRRTAIAPASEVVGIAVSDDTVFWTEGDADSALVLQRAVRPD